MLDVITEHLWRLMTIGAFIILSICALSRRTGR
jgi:hypothetical protein